MMLPWYTSEGDVRNTRSPSFSDVISGDVADGDTTVMPAGMVTLL
jgi:hypothetical protein